ncbi:MAG: hypothetical protein MR024_03495 [Firmicutes bacterium]|nr:hypothetical protein [Bacillota bacterium]
MKKMIKFGTSGFRGIIGEDFTKENVQKIAYALSKYFEEEKIKKPSVVIGYDNRFMSETFAKWLGETLSSLDVKVFLYDHSVPSPVISYMTKIANLGLMITASHNPYMYNGIKIFERPAKEVDDVFCARIEKWANEDINIQNLLDKKHTSAKIEFISDISEFCESILSFVDINATKKCKFKILFNAMNGNSTECLQYLFKRMGIKNFEYMNVNRDVLFRGILPAPYKKNLDDQVKKLKDEKFDLGIALDGDGDRISVIDSKGKVLDCNFILPVLYYYFVKFKGYKGGIVKNTALSNLSVKLAKVFNDACYDAKVGFKHIGKILSTTDAFLGGESNGIAFKKHIYSKDGLVVTALLIGLMAESGKTIDELLKEIQKLTKFKSEVIEYAYPISAKQKEKISKMLFIDKKSPKLTKKILNIVGENEYKMIFENDYWATIRFSGTENVVRIFAEQENLKTCEKIIGELEKFIGVTTRQ